MLRRLCTSPALRQPRITATTEIASTRWLKLQTLDYVDQVGNQRKWDMASRTTKSPTAEADAVVILALLRQRASSCIETLVVQQYRPPMDRTTVELPAGLIDEGESKRPQPSNVRSSATRLAPPSS